MDKLRLKGFEDKWEKALFKGKELLPQCSLAESGISDGAEITTIKIWLHAEGDVVHWLLVRCLLMRLLEHQ